MYFRFAVVKLSMVVLGSFALIVAGAISPLPRQFVTSAAGYEGPHLDQASGLIGLNLGRGAYLSSWDGEVYWGRVLLTAPADPRPYKLTPGELAEVFSAAGKPAPAAVEHGWSISQAVLCAEALPALPRLLAVTRLRSFDDAGRSLPIQQVTAQIYDVDKAELMAELDLPMIYSELKGKLPEAPFTARLDAAAAGTDGLLVLNLFLSSGNAYSSNIGLWNEQGFSLLPLSGSGLSDSGLVCGPEGRTLWVDEGHCEIFDAAGQRLPTGDLASWNDARRRLRDRLLSLLGICALLSAVPAAALGLLLAGLKRSETPA